MMHLDPDNFKHWLATAHPMREKIRREMMYTGRKVPFDGGHVVWKESAVLMILWEENAVWHTLLMQRNEYHGAHSGQISFPGGRREPSDQNLWETALRETQEETGIAPSALQFLGDLSPLHIPVSGFFVHPFVAVHHGKPSFRPDPREVHHLVEAPLHVLFAVKTKQNLTIQGNILQDVPGYAYGNYFIWGATAMMLREAEFLFHQR